MLPVEIFIKIIGMKETRERKRLKRVCKQWYDVISRVPIKCIVEIGRVTSIPGFGVGPLKLSQFAFDENDMLSLTMDWNDNFEDLSKRNLMKEIELALSKYYSNRVEIEKIFVSNDNARAEMLTGKFQVACRIPAKVFSSQSIEYQRLFYETGLVESFMIQDGRDLHNNMEKARLLKPKMIHILISDNSWAARQIVEILDMSPLLNSQLHIQIHLDKSLVENSVARAFFGLKHVAKITSWFSSLAQMSFIAPDQHGSDAMVVDELRVTVTHDDLIVRHNPFLRFGKIGKVVLRGNSSFQCSEFLDFVKSNLIGFVDVETIVLQPAFSCVNSLSEIRICHAYFKRNGYQISKIDGQVTICRR
jgi:hypothetical protein